MSGDDREHRLGERAGAVFDTWLNDRAGDLHPQDRREAMAFWEWIGEHPRPSLLPPPTRHSGKWRWAAAAALVATVAGSTSWWFAAREPDLRGIAHYAAGQAERRVVRLNDGSTITLAANSRVDVLFTASERHLRLVAGEALFEVAHDKAKPFVVETTHGRVTAVGTAFDVAIGRDGAEVTVVDGTIRIALPADAGSPFAAVSESITKLASKGERVTFGTTLRDGTKIGFITQSAPTDPDAATAWTRGQLVFHGEPLAEVIGAINGYIVRPADRLALRDPAAARTRVYGVVNQGDPAAIRDLIDNPEVVGLADEER